MNKISERHHYVPIFLAKNFTQTNGKLNLYDKKADKEFEAKPKNIFLERNRNTFINREGKKSDVIEKMYSDLDNKFATNIRSIKNKVSMDVNELKLLLFLTYTMKWRVPQYDESFIEAKKCFSIEDLGLGIRFKGEKLNIDLEAQFSTEIHQEIKRFLLAIQPFRFIDDYKKIAKNSFLISSSYPGLIGDCPVNELNVNSNEVFEDFIFPFTENLTLVYSQRIDKQELKDFLENGRSENVNRFIKDFSISRDLSTMALSERLSGGSDKNYLKKISEGYKKAILNNNNKDSVNASVFNILLNFKKYK